MQNELSRNPAQDLEMHPWRRLTRAVALFLLAAILPTLPAGAGEPDPGPELGTNLTRLLSNRGEWPFVDAFKTSVGWFPGENHGCFACPDAGTLSLDGNGWVMSLDPTVGTSGQVAHTLLFLDSVGRYPSGRYTVLYDGHGTLDYDGSETRDDAASQVAGPGVDIVDVDASIKEPFAITLFAAIQTEELPETRAAMAIDAGFLAAPGPYADIDLVFYEGGQHLAV